MSNPQEAQSIQVNAERPHPAAAETTLIPRSLAALADPTRATVLDRLIGGPLSVGQIAQGLPVSRPAVSQHLKVLEDAELVSHQRSGTRHIYQINGAGFGKLQAWLNRFPKASVPAAGLEGSSQAVRAL